MTLKNVLAGIAVKDLKASEGWYEKLIGRKPDKHPMGELFEWQFPGGGWLQVFEDGARAGKGSVTFAESDIDDRAKKLHAIGIDGFKTAKSEEISLIIIKDPDGNQIVFAQGGDENHGSVR